MRHTVLILLIAASAAAASAQTAAKPMTTATTTAKSTTSAAKSNAVAASNKLPAGVPAVQGPVLTAFSLKYQEIKIGTGTEAEPNKLYKVHYTGWLASDGRKFDSSYDHRTPVVDADKKPVLDADGKQKLSDPQPLTFPQGFGRLIPGWDQGFNGMRIGGKRRLFIPWQLAYGAKGRTTNDPKNPGIPAKADLIFDVELVDITDIPQSASHTTTTGTAKPAGTTATPAAPATTATPAAPASPATPSAPATPAQPQSK
jgi:peptidylprolyl isomerase